MLFFLLKAGQDLSLFKFKFAHSKNRDCAKINVHIKAVFLLDSISSCVARSKPISIHVPFKGYNISMVYIFQANIYILQLNCAAPTMIIFFNYQVQCAHKQQSFVRLCCNNFVNIAVPFDTVRHHYSKVIDYNMNYHNFPKFLNSELP